MANKIAQRARLMSTRASIDCDVASVLMEASKEIERLEGIQLDMVYGRKVDFSYSAKELAESQQALCARCDQPLNSNGHCKTISCLGLPAMRKKDMADYMLMAAKNMIDDMGVVGMMSFGYSPNKDETFEQAKVRILGEMSESQKKSRMMPPLELTVPVDMMLRAIDATQDISLLEGYAKSNYGLAIAPGETDDEFKVRVKRKLITGSEHKPDDHLCPNCNRPLNCDGHCHHILCIGNDDLEK
ncbi:hypothetical protein VPHD81_0103 [Vibrio phage D81]